jgi:hypothetical protein
MEPDDPVGSILLGYMVLDVGRRCDIFIDAHGVELATMALCPSETRLVERWP